MNRHGNFGQDSEEATEFREEHVPTPLCTTGLTTVNGYFALSIVVRPTVWLALVVVACQATVVPSRRATSSVVLVREP